jgi:hypothetical protein
MHSEENLPYEIIEFKANQSRITKQQLIGFLSQLFADLNEEKWDWEFANSIVLLAVDGEKIVGHYSIIPVTFYVDGNLIKGGKAEGSLVDLNYIRKLKVKSHRDIFGRLVLAAKERIKIEKMHFVFGFPTNQATVGQVKGGFELVEVEITNSYYFLDLNHIFKKFKLGSFAVFLRPLAFLYKFMLQSLLTVLGPCRSFRLLNQNDDQLLYDFSLELSREGKKEIILDRSWATIKSKFIDCPYMRTEVLGFGTQRLLGIAIISYFENHSSNNIQDVVVQDFIYLQTTPKSEISHFSGKVLKRLLEHNVSRVETWTDLVVGFHPIVTSLLNKILIMIRQKNVRNILMLRDFDQTAKYSLSIVRSLKRM